ncbi:MAG: hypothetical protein JSR58_03285 [Verrucomicrobia bacterium]|nr:hypothetical protein [Verrucomicrobiota bacterium]
MADIAIPSTTFVQAARPVENEDQVHKDLIRIVGKIMNFEGVNEQEKTLVFHERGDAYSTALLRSFPKNYTISTYFPGIDRITDYAEQVQTLQLFNSPIPQPKDIKAADIYDEKIDMHFIAIQAPKTAAELFLMLEQNRASLVVDLGPVDWGNFDFAHLDGFMDFVEATDEKMKSNKKIAIHCSSGDKTSVLIVALMIYRRFQNKVEAFCIPRLIAFLHEHQPDMITSKAQLHFLYEYTSRLLKRGM